MRTKRRTYTRVIFEREGSCKSDDGCFIGVDQIAISRDIYDEPSLPLSSLRSFLALASGKRAIDPEQEDDTTDCARGAGGAPSTMSPGVRGPAAVADG
ncbi:hypothetical protein K466DRAFT_584372 [Polyporus arcularius HHB13444]|uniref:Uncharacterized protein n=1 Tax=Polyporus arcularius HHB13444 TaxID=1314778 RepID=A0A5C3PN53_9APHY|nr:hypothetical protein K466DRAFT_584372 [Polyporus arcularius HHB13444]